MSEIRVGIHQHDGAGLAPAQRLADLATAIADQQLDLVICPELFMSGYNVGTDLHKLAEPIDGAFARAVADLANQTGIAVCYGYPQRDGQAVYNSALVISGCGEDVVAGTVAVDDEAVDHLLHLGGARRVGLDDDHVLTLE